MKKPFLLTAGDNFYPESGANDWIGCFETKEDAFACISETRSPYSKYQVKKLGAWVDKDWVEIIDLRHWAEKD